MINQVMFLSVAAAVGVIAATLCAPALPYIADHFSASIASIQFTLSLFLVGNALGQLVSGLLADHIGFRPVMMGGLTLFVVASFAAGASPDISFLLTARFFQGMGSACGPVLARAAACRLFPPGRSAEVQSYGALVVGIASMVAIIGSGYLTLYSWRYNFWLAALFGLLLLIWSAPSLQATEKRVEKKRSFFSPLAIPFTTQQFLTSALCHSLTYGLMYGYIGLFPFLLIHYMHENDPSQVGLYSACMIGCYMVGTLVNSRCVKRISPQKMCLVGVIFQGVGGAVVALSSSSSLFFTGLAIFNVSIGIILPATSACALAACKGSEGAASSTLGLSYRFIGSIFSMLIATLPLAGGSYLGLTIVLASLSSIILLRKPFSPHRKTDTQAGFGEYAS